MCIRDRKDLDKAAVSTLEEYLDKDDKGSRILIVMPESIGDVYLTTSILPNIKKLYPDHNLYFATKEEYHEVLDGNPHVHKVIPYMREMENLIALEGQGEKEGSFEIAFLPFIGTQRNLNYMHNGKDKIQFDLCT